MTLLLFGGSGRLGTQLLNINPNIIAPTSSECDITKEDQIKNTLDKYKPDIIIHAAGWVDVRGCQENPKKAWEINVEGTRKLIRQTSFFNNTNTKPIYFIYISTACVFDGIKGNFSEKDIPSPVNFYGLSKLLAEQIVQSYNNYLIIRTDFVAKAPWPHPGAFIDRYSTSVFAPEVAQGILDLIPEYRDGIVHLTSNEKITHYDLASIVSKNVNKIKLSVMDFPLPKDQSLISTKNTKPLKLIR